MATPNEPTTGVHYLIHAHTQRRGDGWAVRVGHRLVSEPLDRTASGDLDPETTNLRMEIRVAPDVDAEEFRAQLYAAWLQAGDIVANLEALRVARAMGEPPRMRSTPITGTEIWSSAKGPDEPN